MEDDGEWQDIMSNRAVLKQVVRASPVAPPVNPEFKQEVTVHVVGRTKAEPKRVFTDTRADNQPITTVVGENILDYLPPGVMLCLRSMAVGEIARLKLESRFAFGLGAPWVDVGPDTDVEYEIELLSIGDYAKEVPEMSLSELTARTTQYKTRGNEFFGCGEFEKALRCYKEGVRFGDGAVQLKEDEGVSGGLSTHDLVFHERVACLSNIALILERQGKLKEAMETTVQVLEADPNHLKSLIRAARIAVKQGSHEEAEAAVRAAERLAPGDADVARARKDLDVRVAKYKQLEKERWGGFLKPVAPGTAESLRQRTQAQSSSSGGDGGDIKTKDKEEEARQGDELHNKGDEKGDSLSKTEEEDTEDADARPFRVDDVEPTVKPEEEELDLGAPESFRERVFTADRLEMLARMFVLLSPVLVFFVAMSVWNMLAA